MHRLARRGPLVVSTACALLAGPVAGAQASNSSIRATIRGYNGRIAQDEARIRRAAAVYDRTGRPAPLIAALKGEVRDLRALRTKLARDSGSTARGRRGKNDVVKGLRMIATGYTALAKDVRAASERKPVTAAQVNAARATDRKGHNRVVAGLKLLSK